MLLAGADGAHGAVRPAGRRAHGRGAHLRQPARHHRQQGARRHPAADAGAAQRPRPAARRRHARRTQTGTSPVMLYFLVSRLLTDGPLTCVCTLRPILFYL